MMMMSVLMGMGSKLPFKKALATSGVLSSRDISFLSDSKSERTINMVRTEVRHLKTGDSQPPLQEGLLRLYSMRFCPYAQRIHLVLDVKKIKYDTVNVDLHTKPEWIFSKNPEGKVPIIEFENGDTLYESLIIADYLDEKYPEPPLYPKDPLAKAKDKLLVEKFNSVTRYLTKLLIQGWRMETGVWKMETFSMETMNEFKTALDLFERELTIREQKFFGGDKPGMLDIIMWPWFERVDILKIIGGDDFKIPSDRFPKILEWSKSMRADDGVRISYLDAETHAKYFCTRYVGHPNYDLLIKSKQ